MYTLDEIKELIKLVDESSLQELEIEKDDSRICLRKQSYAQTVPTMAQAVHPPNIVPSPPPQQPVVTEQSDAPQTSASTAANDLHTIVSPMVGTFYVAPAPDAPPFVHVGDKVTKNTVVCIVEAMKLMNEIEAEVDGEIVQVLVEDGQLVEFGQPLFAVKTS